MSSVPFIASTSTPSPSLPPTSPTPSIDSSSQQPTTPPHRSSPNPNLVKTRNPSSASPGSTPSNIANGYLSYLINTSDFPPKPNGNAPLAPEKRTLSIHGATNRPNRARTTPNDGSPDPNPSANPNPTPSDFTKCARTFTSGAPTGSPPTTTRTHPKRIPPAPPPAPANPPAADHGATTSKSPAAQPAPASPQNSTTPTTASASLPLKKSRSHPALRTSRGPQTTVPFIFRYCAGQAGQTYGNILSRP
jgi:hypothetical protein